LKIKNYKLKIEKLTLLIFPLIFVVTTLLFYPSFNYYFFQDDWFVLNWVQTGNLASFFSFRPDVIYWRPISMPLFFKYSRLLFDFNPSGFHLVVFLSHLANIILIYVLFRQLKLSQKISLLSSFLYGTAAFHFVPLSWLATTSYVLGPTFILAALTLFLKERIIGSFILFLASLATSEFTLTILPIALIVGGKARTNFKRLLPFGLVAAVYLLARFVVVPIPATGQYEISLQPKILTNLAWYFLWIFNFPEKMATIFFFANPAASLAVVLPFARLLILPLLLILIFVVVIFKSRTSFEKLFRGFGWFLAGITPVIFLPNHAYPMYLVIASLGILYILAVGLDKLKIFANLIIAVFAISWLLSSLLTISFSRKNHWISNEQAISRAYVEYTRMKVKDPSAGSIFIFKPADLVFSQKNKFTLVETEDNVKQVLNGDDAMQVFYNDSTIKSYYLTHQQEIDFPASLPIFVIAPTLE